MLLFKCWKIIFEKKLFCPASAPASGFQQSTRVYGYMFFARKIGCEVEVSSVSPSARYTNPHGRKTYHINSCLLPQVDPILNSVLYRDCRFEWKHIPMFKFAAKSTQGIKSHGAEK